MTNERHSDFKAIRQLLTDLEIQFEDPESANQNGIMISALISRVEMLGMMLEGTPPLEPASQNAPYY